MRFMVIVKATADTEAGKMPTERLLAEMGRYNQELVKAGVMQAGEGCIPARRAPACGSQANRTVVNGPFVETAG